MTAYKWSALSGTLTFLPATDSLTFEDPSLSAAKVVVPWGDFKSADLNASGKWVWLYADLKSLTSSNLIFADGSLVLIGDNTNGVIEDDRGNLLAGSDKADLIYGLGGNDTLNGGGGADSIFGGDGDDRINAADGADALRGEKGNDILDGGNGDDTLNGGAGDDYIFGGAGNDNLIEDSGGKDTLLGGDGDDYISTRSLSTSGQCSLDGGDGDDRLTVGAGNNTLRGGAGDDFLTAKSQQGNDLFDGGDGNDTIQGGIGDNTLLGGAGDDYLSVAGNLGRNQLDGGEGNDTLYGGSQNDTLIGGSGVNRLEGGYGDDVYMISSRDDTIVDTGGDDTAIVSVDFARVSRAIEHVTYINGAKALPYWIDALLPQEAGTFPGLLGQSKTFNYVYPTVTPAYDYILSDSYGYTQFNAQQKAFSVLAMNYISTVVDLHFVETSDASEANTIAFATNNQSNSSGYAYYPYDVAIGSDIFINNSADNLAPTDGKYSALVMIHELGHALGLKHPFDQSASTGVDNGPYLPAAEDQSGWTVMSYHSSSADYHLEYSDLDIAALQYLYGPSKNARTSDDTYGVSGLTSNFVWDGAGKDTLSAAGLTTNATLYLEPGYWGYIGAQSDLISAAGQVTVNFGTVIENLIGGDGDDRLYGNGIGNIITGGRGNDAVDGGAGLDTSAYQGLKSQYTITKLSNGSFMVEDTVSGRDGTDVLTNVEYAAFSDGAQALSAPGLATRDLNGDGHSDILLQNVKDGSCYVWQMNGLGLVSSGYGYAGWTPGAVWKAVTTGDFNADGKSDILLQNSDDGSCYVWQMNSLNLAGYGYVGWTPGKDWQAKATGDFNGDSKSDILLQNALDGSCYVWEMDGLNLLNAGYGYVGWTPGTDWQVKATGDFNGDGESDILLQNALDGSCYVWEMNGLNLVNGGYGYVGWTPGKDWQAKATGDFNGDGKSDIVLQNALDGSCYVWEMDGLNLLNGGYGYVGWTPGKEWEVASAGDYNGDGKSDILLQNAGDGSCYVWELDGINPLAKGNYGYVGWTPGTDWHAVA